MKFNLLCWLGLHSNILKASFSLGKKSNFKAWRICESCGKKVIIKQPKFNKEMENNGI